jgi:hypothetical protein
MNCYARDELHCGSEVQPTRIALSKFKSSLWEQTLLQADEFLRRSESFSESM